MEEHVEEERSDSSCWTQSLASAETPQITPTTQHSVKLLTSKSRVAQQHQMHKSLKRKKKKHTHSFFLKPDLSWKIQRKSP